jgi:ubiquinone/menaquinone biosynthesis C-methylase UbiE
MTQSYRPANIENSKVPLSDRIHFWMMSLVHETLYGLFRDPYQALEAAGLEAGQKVLEVGCGPGFFTVPAAEIVGERGSVIALDIHPLAVEKVQHKIDAAGLTNVKTILADAAQTGLPDQSFDLVFLFGFAHPVGKMDNILTEMHRLLKPKGMLSIEAHRGRIKSAGKLFAPLKHEGRISQFKKVG